MNTILATAILHSLPYAPYASCLSERHKLAEPCFAGTREDPLDSIRKWARSTEPDDAPVFWLNGIAGTGKTSIARTIANEMYRDGYLGADFFFDGDLPELRNPALVFTTIAYQLARFDFMLGEWIVDALKNDPSAQTAQLEEQLKRLLITPLAKCKRDKKRTVVIVLDAFDECDAGGARRILDCLLPAIHSGSFPFTLKLFLTSRPESHITSILAPLSAKRVVPVALHDIDISKVQADIRLFLGASLAALPARKGLMLPANWVKDTEVALISEKAGKLFLYADIAIRFLSDPNSSDLRAQLNKLITILGSPEGIPGRRNPFRELDELYNRFLESRIARGSTLELLRDVLGTLASLRAPVPQGALEILSQVDHDDMETTLKNLHSIVTPATSSSNGPYIYHQSFSDFLHDHNRCAESFWIDTPKREALMAISCLTILNDLPEKLELGGDKIDPSTLNKEVKMLRDRLRDTFSSEIHYSSQYWASHLSSVPGTVAVPGGRQALVEALESFVRYRLLQWLELMSWLGETHRAAKCLDQGKAWAVSVSL